MASKTTTSLGHAHQWGRVEVFPSAVAAIAGHAALGCYGIAGMSARGLRDGFAELLHRESVDRGVDVTEVRKLAEGSQDILRLIRSGECAAVINTPTLGKTVDRDGFLIRRAAVEARVPCLTSLDTALAVVTALRASAITTNVAPLAEYRALEPVATTAAD